MAKKKKSEIDRVVEDLIDGLERPTPQIIKGKKHMILEGDFMTFECDPLHGDRAFGVASEEDTEGVAYYVEIHKVIL